VLEKADDKTEKKEDGNDKMETDQKEEEREKQESSEVSICHDYNKHKHEIDQLYSYLNSSLNYF
jgi:hypothetical protein